MDDRRWTIADGRSPMDDRRRHAVCVAGSVRARTLSEIRVYRAAQESGSAVSAILKRTVFGKDSVLKDQLSRSSSRVAPLIAEGFGQLTDRHVAVYLGRARGSVL